MPQPERRTLPNISTLSSASGLQRAVIATLIKEHRIPTKKLGSNTVVTQEGLPKLINIIKAFPGCKRSFLLMTDDGRGDELATVRLLRCPPSSGDPKYSVKLRGHKKTSKNG